MKTTNATRRRLDLIVVTLAAAVSLVSCGVPAPPPETVGPTPIGMVSSAHPIATRAGMEILEAGGNAFDAAVAVAATLNVVEPMMSGMGGYGTILVYSAGEGRARFLNASDRIPRGVDPDLFRAPTPNYRQNRRGAKAVSTPGNVRAWEAMSQEYGSLDWKDLFDPAILAAAGGFELDERTAASIGRAFDDFSGYSKAIYGRDGAPLRAGDVLVQTDLAASLRAVAQQGPDVFRSGDIAHAIDAAMREAGGFLRLEDIEASVAEWWEPIGIDYRGYQVVTASPPSTAFPSLVRLGIMSRFDVEAMGHNSADFLHTFSEATKHAFWSRLKYAGDPEIQAPPLDMLLSESYFEEQAAAIDPARARPFEYPGIDPGDPDQHTTHFVVADADGNVVSATQTLGNAFGSRIMPEGTGIWLNNSLAYCTFEPPGNPMDAHPGRRKLSGDAPTFILRDGRVWVAIGTPGGHTIGQTVPQMVMNIIDFGMPIQEAIDAPRISFVEPDTIVVEDGIAQDVRAELEARGHSLGRGTLGNAHGLSIEYGPDGRPSLFDGGADRRGTGLARTAYAATTSRQSVGDPYSVTYEGTEGPGAGKHVVLIAGDHEYRSEEILPAMARILARNLGFTSSVFFTLDDEGFIEPGSSNVAGLEALRDADLLIVGLRFQDFPADEMQHIVDYLEHGGPVLGIRTSTHAFKIADGPFARYSWDYAGEGYEGGFGRQVLGETWVGHYGTNHEQSSRLLPDEDQAGHPILRGVRDVHVQSGGYRADPMPGAVVLARGQVLDGMQATAPPDPDKELLPVAWTRTYEAGEGRRARVFTTTHGASEDFLNPGFRRMLINAALWAVGLEDTITADLDVALVGPYYPVTFSFGGYRRGVKPADLAGWDVPIMQPDKPTGEQQSPGDDRGEAQ